MRFLKFFLKRSCQSLHGASALSLLPSRGNQKFSPVAQQICPLPSAVQAGIAAAAVSLLDSFFMGLINRKAAALVGLSRGPSEDEEPHAPSSRWRCSRRLRFARAKQRVLPPRHGADSLLETQVLIIMQMSVCFGFGPFMLRCSQSINQNSVGHGQTGWSGCRPSDGEPPWGSRDPLGKELRRILFSLSPFL